MNSTENRLETISEWIRGGEIRRARLALKELATDKLEREDKGRLAALAWRAGVPLLGIRLLNPLVRPTAKKPVEATQAERAQYAACLIRIGATEEATSILEGLSPAADPQVWLFRTFARVARWEYAESLPLLRAYLSVPALTPYQRLVGEANLAAGLVYERMFEEAEPLLDRLVDTTSREGHRLLLGSALDLQAECQIARRRWGAAEKALATASHALGEGESLHAFFLRKWSAAVRFGRAPKSAPAGKDLSSIREEAQAMGHWETVRFCDRLRAVWGKQTDLFTHVYFGTPFGSFRQWMERDWEGKLNIPAQHRWHLGPASGKGLVLDAGQAQWRDKPFLKPGSLLHRLVLALASDFYRPFRLAVLHHQLYPGEFFHPVHSPPRIYDAVQRYRKEAAAVGVPLEIVEKNGTYRLYAKRALEVQVTLEERDAGPVELRVDPLRQNWGESPFGLREAAELLKAPERTVRRLLATAREADLVETIGRGPATRYRFLRRKAG